MPDADEANDAGRSALIGGTTWRIHTSSDRPLKNQTKSLSLARLGGNTMILRLFMTMCFVALAMSMGATAQAATLDGIEGTVLVNRGSGYLAVDYATQLQTGDSVVAKPGGRGQIIYEEGCTVTVRPGSVVSVGSQSTCKTTANFAETRMGVGAGEGEWTSHVEPDEEGLSAHHILLGTAIAGGIGVGIYYLTKDSDDKPASP